jgi:hypothetical protein
VPCEAEISFINDIFNFLLQIKIDDSFIQRDNYDECNALVIPSDKRRTKTRNNAVTVKRILSKTQRKRLQKIIDKKKKKENVSAQNYDIKLTKVMISLCPGMCRRRVRLLGNFTQARGLERCKYFVFHLKIVSIKYVEIQYYCMIDIFLAFH